MQAEPGSSGNLVLRQAPGGGTEHTIQVDQDGQIVGKDKKHVALSKLLTMHLCVHFQIVSVVLVVIHAGGAPVVGPVGPRPHQYFD